MEGKCSTDFSQIWVCRTELLRAIKPSVETRCRGKFLLVVQTCEAGSSPVCACANTDILLQFFFESIATDCLQQEEECPAQNRFGKA